MKRHRYVAVLVVAAETECEAIRRLRRWLKRLGRTAGVRCVRLVEQHSSDTGSGVHHTDKDGRDTA